MKGIDPKEHLSKEELQDPKKVQNLAPEHAKECDQCPECGQELPGHVDPDKQKSGKDKGPKMRHGQY